MTNFPESLDELKSLSLRYPRVGIGVHLNLSTGRPVSAPGSVPTLVDSRGCFLAPEVLLSRMDSVSLVEVARELRAQVNALAARGIRLDHLSDHNGLLSLAPKFFPVFLEVAAECGVPVRSPMTVSLKYPRLFPNSGTRRTAVAVGWRLLWMNFPVAVDLLRHATAADMQRHVDALDAQCGRHPGILVDYLYGRPTVENALYILRNIPETVSEIVFHLGTDTRSAACPNGLDIGYFANRERELAVITNPLLGEAAASLNIHPIAYRDLRPRGERLYQAQ